MSREKQQNEQNLDPRIEAIFETARGVSIPASPYLKTRVLARLREHQASRRSTRNWKILSLFSAMTSAAIVAVIFFIQPMNAAFEGRVGTPLAVRIEVSPLAGQTIEYVQVELPDGVQFHSTRFPEMAEKKKLIVHWSPDAGQRLFPVVLKGDQKGVKKVKITFLSGQQIPLSTKTIRIRFNAAGAFSGGVG